MPANLPREWFLIDEDFREEKDLEKKIELLKKLISATPHHKGTENLMADLRKRLSRLEGELERKSKRSTAKKETIKKTGDILVSIIGLTQSGKSTLLKSLTNSSVEIDSKPYTTKEPTTGICFFEGTHIQLVEIPSFFLKRHMTIAHSSDVLLLLANEQDELNKLWEILKENKLQNKKKIILTTSTIKNFDKFKTSDECNNLLSKIIEDSNVVRIFTKPVGKPIEKKAVVLKNGSAVKNLVERINKNWLKTFKFARIFDNTKFSGKKVGLEYILKDKDVVEIHTL